MVSLQEVTVWTNRPDLAKEMITCPESFEAGPGSKCYRAVNSTMTLDAAKSWCQEKGFVNEGKSQIFFKLFVIFSRNASLITPESERQLRYASKISVSFGMDVWLGFKDRYKSESLMIHLSNLSL